jgi:Prophage CP4-57 regulatory protein (AlpA)
MRLVEYRALRVPSAGPLMAAVDPVNDIFLTYDELRPHGVPFTRVHLRRLTRNGLFPASYQLSPNRIGWKLSDIVAWKISRRANGATLPTDEKPESSAATSAPVPSVVKARPVGRKGRRVAAANKRKPP